MGAEIPLSVGWSSEQAMETGVARKYGMAGVSFWRWVDYTADEEGNPNLGTPIERRSPGLNYTR